MKSANEGNETGVLIILTDKIKMKQQGVSNSSNSG